MSNSAKIRAALWVVALVGGIVGNCSILNNIFIALASASLTMCFFEPQLTPTVNSESPDSEKTEGRLQSRNMSYFNDDPREYIDSDEGRDVDWDSHNCEPFFTEALPCESCGVPVDSRRPAPWDLSLQVGPCCFYSDQEPWCETMWEQLSTCNTVAAVSSAMETHLAECPQCQNMTAKKAQEDELLKMLESAGCSLAERRAMVSVMRIDMERAA